jgi:hypothetical protein
MEYIFHFLTSALPACYAITLLLYLTYLSCHSQLQSPFSIVYSKKVEKLCLNSRREPNVYVDHCSEHLGLVFLVCFLVVLGASNLGPCTCWAGTLLLHCIPSPSALAFHTVFLTLLRCSIFLFTSFLLLSGTPYVFGNLLREAGQVAHR